MGGVLTVKAGREPNRKLAVSYSLFTPSFVAGARRGNCGLKYVMHSLEDQSGLQVITPTPTLVAFKYVEHMLTI